MAKSEVLDKICKCAGKPKSNTFNKLGNYTIKEDTPAFEFKRDLKQMIKNFEELALHCDFGFLQVII
jgi:hypothetical protein